MKNQPPLENQTWKQEIVQGEKRPPTPLELFNYFLPKYSGKKVILTKELVGEICGYVSQGMLNYHYICNYLGLRKNTVEDWFYVGKEDIKKGKESLEAFFVDCFEKAKMIYYLENKKVINQSVKKGNTALAVRNLEKDFLDEGVFDITETQSVEVTKKGLKLTKETKKVRKILDGYLDLMLDNQIDNITYDSDGLISN